MKWMIGGVTRHGLNSAKWWINMNKWNMIGLGEYNEFMSVRIRLLHGMGIIRSVNHWWRCTNKPTEILASINLMSFFYPGVWIDFVSGWHCNTSNWMQQQEHVKSHENPAWISMFHVEDIPSFSQGHGHPGGEVGLVGSSWGPSEIPGIFSTGSSHGSWVWNVGCPVDPVDISGSWIVFPIRIAGWWFGTWLIFRFIYGIILPIDELIFFKMVIAPPTRLLFGRYTAFSVTICQNGSKPASDVAWICCDPCDPPTLLTTMNHKVP